MRVAVVGLSDCVLTSIVMLLATGFAVFSLSSVVLFVDEADAFLRKRSKASVVMVLKSS